MFALFKFMSEQVQNTVHLCSDWINSFVKNIGKKTPPSALLPKSTLLNKRNFTKCELNTEWMNFIAKGDLKGAIDFLKLHVRCISTQNKIDAFDQALKGGHKTLVKSLLDNYDKKIVNKILKRSKHLSGSMDTQTYILSKFCLTEFIQHIPSMIFFEHSEAKSESPHVEKIQGDIKTVYNNQGYLTSKRYGRLHQTFEEGAPLTMGKKKTPIGYNIHLPPNGIKVNNILVKVYGGDSASKREEAANKPNQQTNLSRYLLNRGTAVVTLNLPDLLKLNVHQMNMSKALNQEIHECIHHFYKTLKNTPGKLHPCLIPIMKQNPKIFHYGHSFGGRTAIEHAELYPNTFDAYISSHGSLSLKMRNQSSLWEKSDYKEWLDPNQKDKIKKIVNPILLMHAKDDNNVGLNVFLDFLRNLFKEKKANLARVFIGESGNPIPSKKKRVHKGHYVPKQKEDFIQYAKTIKKFMKKDLSSMPAFSKNEFLHEERLANQFNAMATVDERFIAYALEECQLNQHSSVDVDKLWDKQYKRLYRALYRTEELVNDKNLLKTELNRFMTKNLLSENVILNLLKSQEKIFSQFMKEYYKFTPTNDLLSKNLFNNKEAIGNVKRMITSLINKPKSNQRYFLFALYRSNPFLLEPPDSNDKQENILKKASAKAKGKLKKALTQERKLMTPLWNDAKKKSLQTQKPIKKQASSKKLKDSKKPPMKK